MLSLRGRSHREHLIHEFPVCTEKQRSLCFRYLLQKKCATAIFGGSCMLAPSLGIYARMLGAERFWGAKFPKGEGHHSVCQHWRAPFWYNDINKARQFGTTPALRDRARREIYRTIPPLWQCGNPQRAMVFYMIAPCRSLQCYYALF